jgi:hypothetical protein
VSAPLPAPLFEAGTPRQTSPIRPEKERTSFPAANRIGYAETPNIPSISFSSAFSTSAVDFGILLVH